MLLSINNLALGAAWGRVINICSVVLSINNICSESMSAARMSLYSIAAINSSVDLALGAAGGRVINEVINSFGLD